MTPTAELLIARLREAGLMLATVESCTGGLVAAGVTDVAGASDVYWGSVVTYHNSVKTSVVGVRPALLSKHGAVSEEVARAMAQGGLALMKKALGRGARGICVATTGIAGPGGGSPEKPVGLCYLGLAATGTDSTARRLLAPAGLDRAGNRVYFAEEALALVLAAITKP